MLHAEWEERNVKPESSIGLRKIRIITNTSVLKLITEQCQQY